MKIAFVAKKGGVGKSTSSLLVAEALRQSGNNVAVQDFDKQGTSSKSINASGSKVQIAVELGQYSYIVFDTKPDLEHAATNLAVREADVILVVTGPSVADLWEVAETVVFAEKTNPRAAVRVLVNKVKAGTILAKSVETTIASLKIRALQTQIPARECVAHFLGGGGWNVLDRSSQTLAIKLALEVVGLTQTASMGQK